MMMALDVINSASEPVLEVISLTLETIKEIVLDANNAPLKKDSFKELADYLERIVPILRELSHKTVDDSKSLSSAIDLLGHAVKDAKQLTQDCTKRNKFYLLINSRATAKHLENILKEISRALGLLPSASLDLSSEILEEIENLRDNLQGVKFQATQAVEEILEKICLGVQERNVNRSYANRLLNLIAEAVGISTERSALKREFQGLQDEIEKTRLNKDYAETIQMDQIIALLERADAASSPREKEEKYINKRNSLGSLPLEPLLSFCCPITREVMEDPVETSSGHIFERSAIEKWFAGGNTICPLTMVSLDTTVLLPNNTLRQSIEEWKERNIMITIANIKPKLMSEEKDVVLKSLEQLRQICEERLLHRDWVILENYIPVLIQLLWEKNREVRNRALLILWILAKDTDDDDAKERIAKVDNGIERIVQFLGRRAGERKLAVALLLELSKCDSVRDYIGKVQGCILLLVTMSNSDDGEAAIDAEELLKNLAFSDQNVLQMAKANYYTYLQQRLSVGSEDVKMTMATALAEMELTNHNKESLFEGGVLGPLLQLIAHDDIEMKKVAIRALKKLSSLPKIGQQMIREGVACVLLDLLFNHGSSLSSFGEYVAATFLNLAISTFSQEHNEPQVSLLESDEDILKLFSLINLSGSDIPQIIIETFHTLCQSPSSTNIKMVLIQSSGVQVLVQLCEQENVHVRASAAKLFCCLVENADVISFRNNVNQRCIETLLGIIKSSTDEEEIASVMGIFSYLPETSEITQWLFNAGALPAITLYIKNTNRNKNLIEHAVGALCRFAIPENPEWQKSAVETGVIPVLVRFLESGTALTKKRAAISLSRFSSSSLKLTKSTPKRIGFFCFGAPPETVCPIHRGICSVESSFCLIEADAVGPLVRNLGDSNPEVSESCLDALMTLLDGDNLQGGSKVLDEANAVSRIIRLLSCSSCARLQEKALRALERIFQLTEFKQKYGSAVQMSLLDLTQRGNVGLKSLAAKILAHLNVLHDQSSYF